MAHDHSQAGHAHDHTAGANAKMLGWALALTSIYLIAEVIGGIVFNSLALLSDAAHMMTDVAALAIALMAIRLGRKAPDEKRTFGYRRFEILAAAFNAVLLFAVAIYVFVEAIKRFSEPQEIQSWGMLIVATIGLGVNLVSMRLLTAGKDASFNVKGAYLEVWADMIGSVGVILGALAIRFTGWRWVDPVVAVAIGLWVLPAPGFCCAIRPTSCSKASLRACRSRKCERRSVTSKEFRASTTCISGRSPMTRSVAPCMWS